MSLNIISNKDVDKAVNLLIKYWGGRGLKVFDEKWTKDYVVFGHGMKNDKDEFFTYYEGDVLIGIISLVTDIDNLALIRDMIVIPEYRGKGYGKKMLETMIQRCKDNNIRKVCANIFPHLEKLYLSLGFEKEGELKDHYMKGENLVIMSKFL